MLGDGTIRGRSSVNERLDREHLTGNIWSLECSLMKHFANKYLGFVLSGNYLSGNIVSSFCQETICEGTFFEFRTSCQIMSIAQELTGLNVKYIYN